MNILFVCLGNVCRSPMAESMFRQLVNKAGLQEKIHVDSAGTSQQQGVSLNPMAKRVMKEHGLPTDGLISRTITAQDFLRADYIICMDNMNLFDLRQLAPTGTEKKIHLANEVVPGHETEEISDPWYTHRFEDTYQELSRSLPLWLNKIEKEIQ